MLFICWLFSFKVWMLEVVKEFGMLFCNELYEVLSVMSDGSVLRNEGSWLVMVEFVMERIVMEVVRDKFWGNDYLFKLGLFLM